MTEQKELSTSSTTVSKKNEVAIPTNYIPTASDWQFMVNWGAQAIKSQMLPTSIRSPEAAAIIILKGRELGLSFMTAIAHIHVISGKPTLSAELIQAMAKKNIPGLKIIPVEMTSEKATVKIKLPEEGAEWFTYSFTLDDAKKAELLKNPTWQKYPRAMLWSRCVTAALRIVCPEALMGISYTPEEMGANVDGNGNYIETTGKKIEDPAIEPVDQKPTKQQLKDLFDYSKLHSKIEFVQEWFTKHGLKGSNELTLPEYVELMTDLSLDHDRQPPKVVVSETPEQPAPWEAEASDFDPRIVK